MATTSIVKVDSPSCIWSRVYLGPGGETDIVEKYKHLMLQMNLFYHDVTKDQQELKPSVLEEGQVCVVYWSVLQSWCRAVVESLIVDSVCCTARCLLVDHGEHLVVSSDQIRVVTQNFLQLPFWVKRLHLMGIKPTTLQVDVLEERAKLIPSTQWDSSATLYLHNLLRVSTKSEVVLLDLATDPTPIMLYVTVGNIKICVNDDLVAKKFALYNSQLAAGYELDEVDQEPVMLPASILKQTACTTTRVAVPVLHQSWSMGGACDHLAPPSTPKRPQHKLEWSEDGHVCAGSQAVFRLAEGAENDDAGDDDDDGGAAAECAEDDDDGAAADGAEDDDGDVADRNEAECVGEKTEERRYENALWCEAAQRTCSREQDVMCARFLKWLNPDLLDHDPDALECKQVVPSGPSKSTVLVHSALPVEPCSSWDDAPIMEHLRRGWWRAQYSTLSPADCYSWPAMARGCNTLVISQNSEQPLSYLAPFLTNILLSSIFTCQTSSKGPIAVVLCSGWEKAQVVYDLLEEIKVNQTLHSIIILLGLKEDEAKAFKIPKNCLLLVTTPFTLVRLLSCHCFLFLRLSHLVLDEADRLFTLAPEQMVTILQHFQKGNLKGEPMSRCHQLVAVAKRWSGHMGHLLANYMPHPCIVLSVLEEVALYADIQQIVLVTMESKKSSELLDLLDLNPNIGQKTLVITRSALEVEEVFKALSSKSAFCLMVHETLTHRFDCVMEQWREDIGPSTHIILVTSTECLKSLSIRDATSIIHYDFPASPKVFGQRLFCMADNFRNLSEQAPLQALAVVCPAPVQSVLFISERSTSHSVGILHYLERTCAQLPPQLLSFVQGVLAAREEQKMDRPLCSYLKTIGVCRDSSGCPDRHRLIYHLDQPLLPTTGLIEVQPLYVKTASVFYGRIIRKECHDDFQSMVTDLTSHYAEKKLAARQVKEGGLYVVQEATEFHRVKILSVSDRSDRLFSSNVVWFIDVGKTEEVKSYQLLELPQRYHSVPSQAVEMIVCGVRPADSEKDWHPKVTRAIREKIQGVPHQARVVFTLGRTVFLDPMVCVAHIPGMRTVINEYNVHTEILNTGMAVKNPDHLDLLRALCQEMGHMSGSGEAAVSLGARIQAEETVLGDCSYSEPLGLGSPVTQALLPVEPAGRDAVAYPAAICEESSLIISRTSEDGRLYSSTSQPTAIHLCEDGSRLLSKGSAHQEPTRSFHPQVRWYQTRDFVMVTVKLLNPEDQSCHFYPDRVVYSGRANGRKYWADLELQASIHAESCCWEMSCNEPVLKLVKQKQGYWERFSRNKNIFVSYDTEHFEKEEAIALNGPWFVEETGEDNWYMNSDSTSESD
ncbi:putative ATP-dependent RNA helicase TDRD12 isoform X3 [Takifugu rubripes]|uniref:putative ATP-dependent RNA helicase TDRD12 isoform X3 n=1 Tax=Takifugu rubripes TaxID=31033 RepID=UPI001145A57B|nr:putative ATP-dependent RNA helicase TDRD12 isoform X3 [Takifugu rubripes]